MTYRPTPCACGRRRLIGRKFCDHCRKERDRKRRSRYQRSKGGKVAHREAALRYYWRNREAILAKLREAHRVMVEGEKKA